MVKRDDILTLNTGVSPTQTNNGKTRHTGIEASVGWRISPEFRVQAAGSVAEHVYTNWVTSGGNFTGKNIAAAPRFTSAINLDYTPAWLPGLSLGLEMQSIGATPMNDANTFTYRGHNLVNLRADYQVHPNVRLFTRVMNLTDIRWATSAQVSGGAPQYAPGLPLSAYGGVVLTF
jgi:outer membrane receptor protein involved in Fe transport